MADKVTIFYPENGEVDSCFGPVCLVCLAATEAAKTRPAPISRSRVTKISPLPKSQLRWSVMLRSDGESAAASSDPLGVASSSRD
jgi:hypothetical protein